MSINNKPVVDSSAAIARATEAATSDAHEFGDFFLTRFLGLQIEYDDTEQTCSVSLPYSSYLTNPQGSMHGGILVTALDISMGHLTHQYLSTALTVEMSVRFLRPLRGDGVATARFLKKGRRLVYPETKMNDSEGRLVAHAVGSWYRPEEKTN